MNIRFAVRYCLIVAAALAVSCEGVEAAAGRGGTAASRPRDVVHGNLVQFDDNGAWCWYQDERAVVDERTGALLVASVGNYAGAGGRAENGGLDAVAFDLASGRAARFRLRDAFTSYGGGDDHNCPALLALPDGSWLAVYAGHNNDYCSYYRVRENGAWGPERAFDWKGIPGGASFPTTYSNLFYLAAEKRVYNFVRGDARSPNLAVSADLGRTWTYGGRLTSPERTIGYVNGYFKYSSNGKDRIDFICTEHHPRDYDTSIYHGFVKGGKSCDSTGRELDADVSDKEAPNPSAFTLVFKAGTVVRGVSLTRAWTIDLQDYDDGTITALFEARADDRETDHRFFYARCDGRSWRTAYLGKAGSKMYESEEDYVGLGALDPGNPDVIYLSTPIDPRDERNLKVHEIFKGVSPDRGVTWRWTPVTENSTRDNFRPIVPAWNKTDTALLWWRGTYWAAQHYDAAVVGLIDRPGEERGPKTYVDATAENTARVGGDPLGATVPDSRPGANDGRWHWRAGFGNGSSVLAAAETGGELAPELATRVAVARPGAYDVWVNFWANPDEDWRIRAGLDRDGLALYRSMACRTVEPGEYAAPPLIAGAGDTSLYQAYLGRVTVKDSLAFDVFVANDPIRTGTENDRSGGATRTWFDGVSYARVGK